VDRARRYELLDHIVFRPESDGGFLFDPQNGNLKYLNHTAREIYQLLENRSDLETLANAMTGRYPDQSPDKLREDIAVFLESLAANHFIR
jgi:hypothetical protein